VNNYTPPFSKLKTFQHKISATLSSQRQLVIMLHRDPNASGSTPGLKAYTSSWSMRSQVHRTAHDVILYAPITGTPPSLLPAIVAARASNEEGVSQVEKKSSIFSCVRTFFFPEVK